MKEIVSYRDHEGREGMRWCKYGKRRLDVRRGGASYEAIIYRRFLRPDAVRINKSKTAGVMGFAAAWI